MSDSADTGEGHVRGGAPADHVIGALLFGFALLVRFATWPTVVLGDRILFFGSDAYYHMRRVAYTLTHFPARLDFDPYINYPQGARAIWTPLFDMLVSTLLLPLRDAAPRTLELAASVIPPVIGALTVVLLYRIALRHFDRATALVAAFALALMPGHFWYSQLGFVDHHCLIALVTTALLGAAMEYRRAFVAGTLAWQNAGVVGLLFGLCIVTWPGTILQIGIVQIALLGLLLACDDAPLRSHGARRLALVHGVAFCCVAPFALGNQWGQWSGASPVVLSNFQPWYLGSAIVFALVCERVWSAHPALGASALARTGVCAGVGAALLALGGFAVPGLADGSGEAFAWFGKTDAFQALVGESTPLFIERGSFSLAPAAANLSAFALLAPAALVLLFLLARRGSDRPGVAALNLLLGWAAVLCIVAAQQRRFVNTASVALALVLGVCLRMLYLRMTEAGAKPLRALALPTALVTLLALLAPFAIIYVPIARSWQTEAPGVRLTGVLYNSYAMVETAGWLRRNTEPTSGWLDPSVQPEYGVLAPWTIGHVLEYVARRPTVTNNFGDDIGARNFNLAQAYFQAEEEEANAIADELGVRYVVFTRRVGFLPEPPGPRSIYRALFGWDGAEFTPEDAAQEERLPGVSRHRLVYEFARTRARSGQRPSTKVYEIVRGADVRGQSTPGTEVRIHLDLLTQGERLTRWASRTTADENGRWHIRVPYANDPGRGAVYPGETYTIECDPIEVARDADVEPTHAFADLAPEDATSDAAEGGTTEGPLDEPGSESGGEEPDEADDAYDEYEDEDDAPVLPVTFAEFSVTEREVRRGAIVNAPEICGERPAAGEAPAREGGESLEPEAPLDSVEPTEPAGPGADSED